MVIRDENRRQWLLATLGAAVGIAVWLITSRLANNTDPTGSQIYWLFGYPALFIAAFGIAFFAKVNSWMASIATNQCTGFVRECLSECGLPTGNSASSAPRPLFLRLPGRVQ
jgi:hypothetical protein